MSRRQPRNGSQSVANSNGPQDQTGAETIIAERARDVPEQQLAPDVTPDDLVALNTDTGLYERLPLSAAMTPRPAEAACDDEPVVPVRTSVASTRGVLPRAADALTLHGNCRYAEATMVELIAELLKAERKRTGGTLTVELSLEAGEARRLRINHTGYIRIE